MKFRFAIPVSVSIILAVISLSASAQKASGQWLRVITGDDLNIDVDRTSLVLESESIFRATFRTTLAAPETLPGNAALQYQSRVDQIEFNINKNRYRIFQSDFFQGNAEKVSSISGKNDEDWKPIFGKTAHILRGAAEQLPPFGIWKVITYHYASGEEPSNDDPESLRSLVGRSIEIRPSYLFIGNSNCPNATTEFRHASDRDLSPFGLSLKDFGVDSMNMSIIAAVCKSNKDYPSQIMVFLQSPAKAKLLWDGVFFDIERRPNDFKP